MALREEQFIDHIANNEDQIVGHSYRHGFIKITSEEQPSMEKHTLHMTEGRLNQHDVRKVMSVIRNQVLQAWQQGKKLCIREVHKGSEAVLHVSMGE